MAERGLRKATMSLVYGKLVVWLSWGNHANCYWPRDAKTAGWWMDKFLRTGKLP